MDERRTVRVSKYLSKHLRHQPERLGLRLDTGGWVDVDELLKACARNNFPLTRAAVAPAPVRPPAEPVTAVEPAEMVLPPAEELAERIAHTAAEILAAPPGSVDPADPLYVAGMDSVLAGQLRVRLMRDLDMHVPLADLLDDRPLINVVRELAGRSA